MRADMEVLSQYIAPTLDYAPQTVLSKYPIFKVASSYLYVVSAYRRLLW